MVLLDLLRRLFITIHVLIDLLLLVNLVLKHNLWCRLSIALTLVTRAAACSTLPALCWAFRVLWLAHLIELLFTSTGNSLYQVVTPGAVTSQFRAVNQAGCVATWNATILVQIALLLQVLKSLWACIASVDFLSRLLKRLLCLIHNLTISLWWDESGQELLLSISRLPIIRILCSSCQRAELVVCRWRYHIALRAHQVVSLLALTCLWDLTAGHVPCVVVSCCALSRTAANECLTWWNELFQVSCRVLAGTHSSAISHIILQCKLTQLLLLLLITLLFLAHLRRVLIVKVELTLRT